MLSIEAKLDDIQAATRRIGRKDWRLVVYGVMLTVIVEGLLPRDAVHDVVTLVVHGLDQFFGAWHSPPRLPPGT